MAFGHGRLLQVAAAFHRRMVELAGIAGMLHEITERHTADSSPKRRNIPKARYDELVSSYARLIALVRAGEGNQAEAHWHGHMDRTRELLHGGLGRVKVQDALG